MTIVYVFPGQGSHRPGMGGDLFDRYPHLVRQADAVLGYSIAELCLRGSPEQLTDTRVTQCAVYVVDVLAYVDRVRDTGVIPDLVAGHSLGEYAALYAAGAFDFVTGLDLVARRARLMAQAGPGGMAAVIGLTSDQVRDLLRRHQLSTVDIANLNAPEQTVLSGPRDDIDRVRTVLADAAQAIIPLKVSGAFHSRYMAGAAEQFAAELRKVRFGRLKLPVVANVSARPHRDAELAGNLVRQLTEPVRWVESVDYLLDHPDPEFHEVGPGQVLTGLIRAIQQRRHTTDPVRA